jgi:hypothetical protein
MFCDHDYGNMVISSDRLEFDDGCLQNLNLLLIDQNGVSLSQDQDYMENDICAWMIKLCGE